MQGPVLSADVREAKGREPPLVETERELVDSRDADVLCGRGGLTIWEKPGKGVASGPMAEWLRRGLQILARRFDSGSGLHPQFET